ncbi:MAG TPA: hypothetical protein VK092_03220, partial [Deinococcales bacterium]|nr:hypothetical protein [Deinococcales bacterium]
MNPSPGLSEPLVTALLFEPFELWWAAAQDPPLRTRPLVSVREGRVRHANAAAHREGIVPGLPLAAARLKTAGLHVTTLEVERLHSEWDRQLDELHGWSPHLFSPAPGLAWLLSDPGEARRLAFEYGVAAGSAASRDLALAAARLGTSGDVRVITRGREQQFLAGIRTEELPLLGFGDRTALRLRHLGVRLLRELFPWKEAQLRSVAGAEAEELYRLLHGPREQGVPLYRQAPRLECRHDFPEPVHEPREFEPALRLLARRLAAKLAGRTAGRLSIACICAGVRLPHEVICREPAHREGSLLRLLRRALQGSGAAALGVDSLTVVLSELRRSQS